MKERDETIETLKLSSSMSEKVKDISIDDTQVNPVSAPQPQQIQQKDNASFDKFLDLRKRLRRSIFRGEEVCIVI